MGSITVHIWRGQISAIARFARENRNRLIADKKWDLDPAVRRRTNSPPTTDIEIVEAAFLWWLDLDCPLFDWCKTLGQEPGSWAPVVKDSVRLTIPTDDLRLLTFVQTLSEYRGWLGRGSRIGVAVPPRATLAIVGEYMLEHLQPYHFALVYPSPTMPNKFLTIRKSTQNGDPTDGRPD